MPCTRVYPEDFPPADNYSAKDCNEVRHLKVLYNQIQNDYSDLKNAADQVTQLLCYVTGVLRFDNEELFNSLDLRYLDWVAKHDEWDFERTSKAVEEHCKANPFESKEQIRKRFIDEAEKVHPLSYYHQYTFFDKVWKNIESKRAKIDEKTKALLEIEKLMHKHGITKNDL